MPIMPKTVQIMATQTDRFPTHSSLLEEAQRRFDTERNEKNSLYSYLIEEGLMDGFINFKKRKRQ